MSGLAEREVERVLSTKNDLQASDEVMRKDSAMTQQQSIILIGRGLASGERTRESPINSRYLWIFGLGIALAMLAVLVVFGWEGLKLLRPTPPFSY